ncbi:hypothetical protein U9M48_018420 [Paspalum notatum var. saurae]|uniref:ARM repeat superfamily protein n=1 Tax=Paspalum notatum var. saurae TaxID=547442 RepID=A0AAQ3TCS6_PASNO
MEGVDGYEDVIGAKPGGVAARPLGVGGQDPGHEMRLSSLCMCHRRPARKLMGSMAAGVGDRNNSNHQSIPVAPDHQPPVADAQPKETVPAPWEGAEKRMNRFIRTVALLERLGNGLGTLAFTWATVVILGGFSTNLGQDFWYATAIVFIEAFRVFSRENRSDDELLFKTTGSIRLKRVKLIGNVPYYLNVGIVMVSLYGTLELLLTHYKYLSPPPHHELQWHRILLLAALLALASMVQLPTFVKCMKGKRLLQCSPLVAVLAFGGVLIWTNSAPNKRFAALVVAPLFVGCLQYSLIEPCLQRTKVLAKDNLPVWLQKVGPLVFPLWIAISVPIAFHSMGVFVLLGTLIISNIQIPVALARIALSSMRLSSKDSHNNDGNEHVDQALKIFYSMVLGQGTLYVLACICESLFFFYLRRSLAVALSVPACKDGFHSVDEYYEHAYDKCMKDGVLAQEDLTLVRFGVDSLNSNSRTKKLAALQILHSLVLRRHEAPSTKTWIVSEITTSTRAVSTLINMLGWTALEDQKIRFFAAKITAELAGDLLIVGIPGTMQMVSSLLDLDAKNHSVKRNVSAPELCTAEQRTDNSAHAVCNGEWISKICKLWQHIKNKFSVPNEGSEPWTDEDSLPIQGMIILEKLTHNLDNCAEINRATGLIPKIIEFMSYNTGTEKCKEIEVHQKLCITSSLRLVSKLVNTKGEAGLALRRKISGQPFLLSNLAEILEDGRCGTDQLKLMTMDILSKIAVDDDETSHDMGSFKLFIPMLMQKFLGRDELRNNSSLRRAAVEALSILSMQNTYCSSVLEETTYYDFFDNLENILDEFGYFAATLSLLQNLCAHSRDKLWNLRSNLNLSFALHAVLRKMMSAEGKQLESLIGLASQMHNVIPERLAHELSDLSHTNNGTRLVRKLVGTLNRNKKPSHEYPRMRRVVIEMAISILESCPLYANIFREQGMMEALTMVERTPSKVEKYMVFFSDIGMILERGLPLGNLVAKAKGLIDSASTSWEWSGNALGTLAFLWATVVLLGGYCKDLKSDFWYTTAMIFIEAFSQLVSSSLLGISSELAAVIAMVVVLLIGNLQIPMAVARIVLSSLRFGKLADNYPPDHENKNLMTSLVVFYVLTLCQGTLYMVACVSDLFSFFLRRSLAHQSGLRGKRGARAVDLYYHCAYLKCMETGILAAGTEISLTSFAMESLSSSQRKAQLAGLLVIDGMLQQTEQIAITSRITNSKTAVSALIGMLGWADAQDRDIRLFAARVTAKLASKLRVAATPGMLKLVSSLLDTQTLSSSAQDVVGNNESRGITRTKPRRRQHDSSYVSRNWHQMKQRWSLPAERPLTHHDSFPVLGMLILEGLASDHDNCADIGRDSELISKIIGFISYTSGNAARQKAVVCASLRILEDSRGSIKAWEPTMDIIAKLALAEDARQEIGNNRVITGKLMHAFLGRYGPTNMNYSRPLRLVAGEALANLAIESADNCLVILEEHGYKLIEDLRDMLWHDEYRDAATTLLQNLCAHSRDKMHSLGANEHFASVEGKQLETLMGLVSQICNIIPECVIHCLESQLGVSAFVQKNGKCAPCQQQTEP